MTWIEGAAVKMIPDLPFGADFFHNHFEVGFHEITFDLRNTALDPFVTEWVPSGITNDLGCIDHDHWPPNRFHWTSIRKFLRE